MEQTKNKKIILSFDLEFWYNSFFLKQYIDKDIVERQNDFLAETINPILNLFDHKQVSATFFITGEVAEKYPELVKKIAKRHEVASHGYCHKFLFNESYDEIYADTKKSKEILERITNEKILGFRAPSYSLNYRTFFLIKILNELDFKYDSSLLPAKFGLYGANNAEQKPFIIGSRGFLNDPRGKLFEFPLNILNLFFVKFPVSGGFYFRLIPYFIYKKIVKHELKKNGYFVFFVHPHDFLDFIPNIKAPQWKIKLRYLGTRKTFKKFKKFINDFEFINFRDYLHDKS